MNNVQTLNWDGFRGKNTKADEFDIADTQALELNNLRLGDKIGAMTKVKGYGVAALDGVEFSADGLDGSINCIAELIIADTTSDSPYYICQAGTDDKFYQWNSTTAQWDELTVTTNVDTSAVKAVMRDAAVEFMCGSDADSYPVLAIWCGERFTNAYNDGLKTEHPIAAGMEIDTARIKNPDIPGVLGDVTMNTTQVYNSAWAGLAQNGTIGFMGDAMYAYRFSIQYDNGQWSPPGTTVIHEAIATGNDGTQIQVELACEADIFNKRITGIKVFRCDNYSNAASDVWRLLRTIMVNDKPVSESSHEAGFSIDADYGTHPHTAHYYSATKLFVMFEQSWYAFASSGNPKRFQFLGVKPTAFGLESVYPDFFTYLLPINYVQAAAGVDTISVLDGEDLADGDYYVACLAGWFYYAGAYNYTFIDADPDISDQPEMWEHLGYAPDTYDSSLNYEVCCFVGKRKFVARYWDGDKKVNNVIRASYITTEGAYAYDIFQGAESINVQEFGITEIMNLGKWQDKLVVFGRENIIVLDLGTGETFTWRLNDTFNKTGLAAIKSLVSVLGSTYYIGGAAPSIFRNMQVLPLAQLEDRENFPLGVTTLSEGVGGYDIDNNEVLFSFPTDVRVIVFNVLVGEWYELTPPAGITQFLNTNDGRLLFTDGAGVYEFDDTADFNGTDIVPLYKSKTIHFPGFLIAPVSYEIRYESDSDLTLKLWLDDVLQTLPDQGLSSSVERVENWLPAGKLADRINFALTLSAAQAAANTSLMIKSFTLRLHLVKQR